MRNVNRIPPEITRAAVAKLKAEPDHAKRAAMLCTAQLDLSLPAVMGLFESVNVPKAGEWGQMAQERMRRERPRFNSISHKHKPVMPVVAGVGDGNLFVDFADEENPPPPLAPNHT